MKTARISCSDRSARHGFLARLQHEDAGQDLIEYALIGCFIALGTVASMQSVVTAVLAVVSSVGATLTTAT